jgi:AsmA-like C-terminal region
MDHRRLAFLVLSFLTFHSFLPLHAEEKSSALKPKFEKIFSNFLRRELEIGHMRWVFFPLTLSGKNIKLWEKPGLLMAEAPRATTRISLKTLTSGRLRVDDMTFIDGIIYFRFHHNGRTNVGDMIVDLAKFARANYKPGQKQKVAYNTFKIINARVDVINADTGRQPLGTSFIVNGEGDISGLGPQTQFPFHLTAISTATANPVKLDLSGTISNRPNVAIHINDIPVTIAVDFLPVLKWFEGTLKTTINLSKAGIYSFWRVKFDGNQIKTWSQLPFPIFTVKGKFHPFAPSTLQLSIDGKSSHIDVFLLIKDLVAKKTSLTINSTNADLRECIEWCRTGTLMGQGETSETKLLAEIKKPLLWNVSGQASIEAKFSSVLGPWLFRDVDGELKLTVKNGRLTDMPGFVKALTLLNLAAVLKGKDANEPGLPFENVYTVIDIKDGVATTREPILLESPVLNVAFQGRVNFPKNVINAKIRLGKIWVNIKGPLDNPAVYISN